MPDRLDPPPRLTWLIHNLRWLLVAAMAAIVFDHPENHWWAIGILGLLAFHTAGLALAETLVTLKNWWHGVTLMVDIALCATLAVVLHDPRLMWVALLPGFTAALRFSWLSTLAVTLATYALQTAFTLYLYPDDQGALFVTLSAAFVAAPTAVGMHFAARNLRSRLRLLNKRQVSQEANRANILRQHARAIYEMSSMVSATLNYEEVLDAALNFGAVGVEGAQASSSTMVSAVLFFEDDQLHVASYRRLTSADLRVVCPGRAGVLGEVVRTGEPEVITDLAHDPELQQFASFQQCQALMALPLRAGYETYGVVVYAHPRPDFFDDDQRALLIAVVNQAIIALQNAQLYRNLRLEKERIIEVQEEAQKKLARDLHDGPTQGVAALAMRANFVRRLLERDPKAAAEELFKMEDLARRTTKEIRHMLFTLRPLVLESQGLVAALQQLAEKMHETHNQNVIVEAEPGVDGRLELNHMGVLFYIVEEAVNNARKHAQAEHIWVRLKTQNDVLLVEIQDDGVGFNVGAVDASYDKRGSLGMVNMRERAEMVSGAVKIDSAEGRGTKLTVFVPLTDAARERLRN